MQLLAGFWVTGSSGLRFYLFPTILSPFTMLQSVGFLDFLEENSQQAGKNLKEPRKLKEIEKIFPVIPLRIKNKFHCQLNIVILL